MQSEAIVPDLLLLSAVSLQSVFIALQADSQISYIIHRILVKLNWFHVEISKAMDTFKANVSFVILPVIPAKS